MIKFIFLFLISGMAFFSIDFFLYCLKEKGLKRFLLSSIFFVSQIIISETFLGLLYILEPIPLALVNITFSLFLIIYSQKILYKDGTFSKNIAIYLTSLKRAMRDELNRMKEDLLLIALIILFSMSLLWVLSLGILFPATDWDGNSYHLTFVANVIQNGHIYDVPTSIKWLIGYPKGGEFLQLWSVIFTRNDLLADTLQIPFLLVGVLSLMGISIKMGIKKNTAFFSSLLFLFLPIVFNQLKTTYVDVMLAATFFSALYLVLSLKKRWADFLAIGATFALIISFKPTGVLFIAVLSPLLVCKYFKQVPKGKSIKRHLLYLATFSMPILAIGCFWYFKNLLLYKTPIYPFGFKLLGVTIFGGRTFNELADGAISTLTNLPKGMFARIWYVWTEQKDWWGCFYNYDANFTGFGPVWFIVLLPSLLIGSFLSLLRKNWQILTVLSIFIVLFLIYPLNYYPRYVLFFSGVGIIFFGLVLDNIKRPINTLIRSFTLLLCLFTTLTTLFLCNYPPLVIKSQLKINFLSNDRGITYKNTLGEAFLYLENTVQPGEVVAYDSAPNFIYPLWRKDYKNKVIFIDAGNKEDWDKKARDEKVKYLFTQKESREDSWAKAMNYTIIYKDTDREIFKIY